MFQDQHQDTRSMRIQIIILLQVTRFLLSDLLVNLISLDYTRDHVWAIAPINVGIIFTKNYILETLQHF